MLIYGLIIFKMLFINTELKEIKSYNNFFFKNQFYKKALDKNKSLSFEKNIFNNILFSSNSTNTSNNNGISKIKVAELIFSKYYILSFLLLSIGFFIVSYGGYYYGLGLIIHSTLLLFYILALILPSSGMHYPLLFLFSFISGILIYLSIRTKDIKSVKYIIQKLIYGLNLGCFLHKTIFFYFNMDDNNHNYVFILSFCISIPASGIISIFIPELFVFLFCSIISGSSYIINSFNYIIDRDNSNKETFPTFLIIQIIIVVIFTVYQIYHLKYKKNEDPYLSSIEKYEDKYNQRDSYETNTNQTDETQNELDNSKSLINCKISNEEEDGEDEINDKENS